MLIDFTRPRRFSISPTVMSADTAEGTSDVDFGGGSFLDSALGGLAPELAADSGGGNESPADTGLPDIGNEDTRAEAQPGTTPQPSTPSPTTGPAPTQPAGEAPAPAAPEAPPAWMQQWMAQQQQMMMSQFSPIMEQNKALLDRLAKADEERNGTISKFQQEREAAARRARLEASRPKAPDPSKATVEDMIEYADRLSDWKVKVAQEAMSAAMTERFSGLESSYTDLNKKLLKEQEERALQIEFGRIDREVEEVAAKPEYSFLKNDAAKQTFFQHWDAMQARSKNPVSAEDAAKSLVEFSKIMQEQAKAAQEKAAQDAVNNSRRAEQKAIGAPPAMRGTVNTAGNQQQKGNRLPHWTDNLQAG